MLRFSPGIAQGCHELLILTKKHPNPAPYFLSAFSTFGSIASEKIFSTAQAMRWVCNDDVGNLAPTVEGERLLHISSYSARLRRMLLDYVDIERPSWVQSALSGRAKVLHFAGAEIGQIFVEALLADGVDSDTVAFWDTLAARARGLKDERQNQVGRLGERLTLDYETQRTGKIAKWISIESNEDGYDVLSVVSDSDFRKLSIEAKASSMGLHGAFYLTVNEWEHARETKSHAFHLWDVSKTPYALCVLDVAQVAAHVPNDCGLGTWQSVQIPFAAFKENFSIPS